jgi:hypothetical protein
MAVNYLTSETLIESVKNRALIPSNQSTFTEVDFLRFANEEMIIGVVPLILLYHEEYLLFSELVPLKDHTSNYKIPYRATGNKLRELAYQDNNKNIYEMSRVSIEEVSEFEGATNLNNIRHYYVKNNEIILLPGINGAVTGSLIFSYYMRPNNLVPIDQVAVVSNINTGTGEIFVNSIPNSFTLTTKLDVIRVENPFKNINFDITPIAINTTTNVITLNATDLPETLSVGDHIALAGETNIPQISSDLHPILAHRVAIRCLEALGDTQGLGNAMAKLAEMEKNIPMLIDNRIEGSPQKISTRWSMFRLNALRRRRWFRR